MNVYVWLKPDKKEPGVPVGARVLASFESRVKVQDDDGKERWVAPEDILGPMHSTSVSGVDDMTALGDLQECSILRNLQIRFNKNIIYTYIGNILVALNPYKLLSIYEEDRMFEYRKKRLGQLPPHIFAVAEHSFEDTLRNSEKRCVIISGESGAGKTESTKYFLKYLANISNKKSLIEKQILDSNPILEAFGNAKAESNDNSSRFGKYIIVHFDSDGNISSARIKQYLLEKSRVVSQNKKEENYHIFYALLSGLSTEEKLRLGLDSSITYNYLNKVEKKAEGDTQSARHIKSAMRILTFSEADTWSIFQLVAAILHIGQITYDLLSVENAESVKIQSTSEVTYLTKLLKVGKNELTNCLTKKIIGVQGDSVTKLLSKQQAEDARDAFAKRIYVNLFNFIVHKINRILQKDGKMSSCYIGILDIYGFEVFENNSFEQFCINYANEKLQQYFIRQVLNAEQEQYEIEGILWTKIDYTDNTEVLDLIEMEPNGILSIINDQSKFPKGTDQTILDKLIDNHSDNSIFFKPKYSHVKAFGINHYAGVVVYEVNDFVEKNQDACSLSIKRIIQASENEFLKEIFAPDFQSNSNAFTKRTETLISKFSKSLDSLMKELKECEPFFVRCIKPNNEKKPNFFDRGLCYRQLRYSGMRETTKIREAGYAVRYDYFDFVQRFRVVCPQISVSYKTDFKEEAKRICRAVFNKFQSNHKFGRTKIFLKNSAESQLEEKRDEALNYYATTIQKTVRGWLHRKRFKKLKETVLKIENQRLEKIQKLQWKNVREKQKTEIENLRYVIMRLQAWCRGYLTRTLFKRKSEKKGLRNAMEVLREADVSVPFEVFAEKYFERKNNLQFSKKPIKGALLRSAHGYSSASLVLWTTILRFLGNVEEPKTNAKKVSANPHLRSILTQIRNFLSKDGTAEKQGTKSNVQELDRLYDIWLCSSSTNLEKLEFIVSHGIERLELRDEIYCQIYKALNKNPLRSAEVKGWNLLSCCVGCFPPSDLLLPYLKSFIREGPKKCISYCLFRLHRTIQKGHRTQPPCLTEFKSIQEQKPMELEVHLSSGLVLVTKIDSATTASEMLDIVAKNAGLVDTFGFSIVLGHDIKHLSLGDGSDFVMDVVAQCEQYALETGENFKTLPWKLYLKKEMFAPWHDYRVDEVSTGLICAQIADGVRAGEYECEAEDIGSLVAQICYIEYGRVSLHVLNRAIKDYLPHYIYSFPPEEVGVVEERVRSAYFEMFIRNSPEEPVSGSLIKFAIQHWPMQFSRTFHVTGSLRNEKLSFSYPEVPLLVAVNSHGITVIDENSEKKKVIKIDFSEIKDIARKELPQGSGYILIVTSYYGTIMSLLFQSTLENTLHELLLKIIENLKKFSKFAVATKDYTTTDSSFLSLKKGDLITLGDTYKGEDLLRNSWAEGLNERSGLFGNFILDYVKIIPSIEKPSKSILQPMINTNSSSAIQFSRNTEKLKHYNLSNYAATHFTSRDPGKPELWKFSLEKLRTPLHAHLADEEKLSAEAVQSYHSILHFMETNHSISSEKTFHITEKIFGPPIKNEALRDEIYCQIMKQLTANPDAVKEERGWELLWMATGLFSCGQVLAPEVKKFLLSRRTLQLARECSRRFYTALKSSPRAFPPHMIEIEAVKHKPSQILYKVNFSDESHKFFQITSMTKVIHLKEVILNRLKINSPKGFSLCVRVVGRLFVLLDDYYIFDYFYLLKIWIQKYKISSPTWQHQLYFMKKCWRHDVPGEDRIIDLKFIYPQEYKKYIQGYHVGIPLEDLPKLASLLQGVYSNDSNSKSSRRLLHKLIPANVINEKKLEVWLEEIKEWSFSHKSLSEDEKKIEFLKYLHKLPTYGMQHFGAIDKSSNLSNYIFYPVSKSTQLIHL